MPNRNVSIVAVLLGLGLLHLGTARADLLIRNVTLYDGTGAPALQNAFVLVKGERIAAVSSRPIAAHGKLVVIDGTGKFLIPGLMDSHVHILLGQGGPNLRGPDGKPTLDQNGKPLFNRPAAMEVLDGDLYCGVTSFYDSGNDPDFIFPLRADERAGKIISPRVFAAGGLITVPGGFGSARPTSLQVQSWDQALPNLEHRLTEEKPDLVKLIVERRGLYGSKLVPTFTPDMLKRIIDYAHQMGYRATVHISTELDAIEALDAGVDDLAHPVLISTMNDSFIKRLADQKIPVSTTLVSFSDIARVADDPSFLDDPLFTATVNRAELEKQKTVERERYTKSGMSRQFAVMMPYAKANIKALHQAGVILALGTDRSLGPTVHQELELLNESGISPFDLIKVATLNGAIYIGRQKDLGSVEQGKYADLVLLKADPALDVHNFRAIDTVIKGGRQIDLAALDIPINRPH
jgi:imidazolonepropionase-like amidohydrolase